MRLFFIISVGLIGTGFAAGSTALDAVKLLPREHRARVARIEARDGSPAPERWHVLVNDRAAENGLKEYVVAEGAIVAERRISQFAESLAPDQILGDGVRFNSDRAAELVQRYAQANDIIVASIGYQLRRDGQAAVPLWRLTCYSALGREIGSLTITATKGAVISHQGFTVEPAPVVAEKPRETEKPREKPRPAPVAQVVREAPLQPFREAQPPPPPPKKPNVLQRLFGGKKPEQPQ